MKRAGLVLLLALAALAFAAAHTTPPTLSGVDLPAGAKDSQFSGCPPGRGHVGQPGSKQCAHCAVGYFSDSFGAGPCAPCPAGTSTQGETGRVQCTPCKPGSFSAKAASTCTLCPIGQFQDKDAQDTCLSCASVEGASCSRIGMAQPEQCGPGTNMVLNEQGLNVCAVCKAGTFTEGAGGSQAPCTACEAGDWSPEKSDQCWPCDAGTSSPAGSGVCVQCGWGSYSQAGDSSCSLCPAGKYQPEAGQSLCLDCPVGTYSEVGAAICKVDDRTPAQRAQPLIVGSILPPRPTKRNTRPPPHPAPIVASTKGAFEYSTKTQYSELAAAHLAQAALHAKAATEHSARAAQKAAGLPLTGKRKKKKNQQPQPQPQQASQ